MADSNDSVLDKAETLARRILERLGAKVDSKLGPATDQTLSPREVGELTSRIERVIESHLREDRQGVKRVAPNRLKVLFTYEESNRLNAQYIELLAKELKATIFEYINNRRYETRGPVEVETGRDLFAKTTVIKATFEGDEDALKHAGIPIEAPPHPVKQSPDARLIQLRSSDGRNFTVELRPEAAPAYIGRSAGIAVRMDDPSISRMHASLALRSTGDVVAADLGSANGTFVNQQMLAAGEARSLKEGDVIGVGDFQLTVSSIS